jgi:hypothetical protein
VWNKNSRVKKEGGSGWWDSGGGSGDLIDIQIIALGTLIDSVAPSNEYELIVQFLASTPGSDSQQVTLKMPVSKNIYDEHPPGSMLEVRYTVGDPSMAILAIQIP